MPPKRKHDEEDEIEAPDEIEEWENEIEENEILSGYGASDDYDS